MRYFAQGTRLFCIDGVPFFDDGMGDFVCGAVSLCIGAPNADALGNLDGAGQWLEYRHLLQNIPEDRWAQLAGALSLLAQDTHRFCALCGGESVQAGYAKRCSDCQKSAYPTLSPCVIVAICHNRRVLLAVHKRYYPHNNPIQTPIATDKIKSLRHGLIAGFIELGESVETAVRRETQEEVGIVLDRVEYITSQPWLSGNLMLGFIAYAKDDNIRLDTSELSLAQFYALDDLPCIPAKGTIAHTLIATLANRYGIDISNTPTA